MARPIVTFVTITAVTAGTTNLHPTTWVVTGGPVLSVGSSNPVRWGDSNDDGLVQSTPAEINAGVTRYLYMGLQGEAPVTAPASEAWNAGGCLADGVSDRTAAIAASGVKWYNFCFTGTANADDDNLRFLDAYTSGATTGDANLAIYTADGALLAVAGGDRGAGTNPMVSTGVGRRTGDVDGEQFDGWAGDLDNSFGNTYYMAVFEQGGSAGAAFSVAGGPNAITDGGERGLGCRLGARLGFRGLSGARLESSHTAPVAPAQSITCAGLSELSGVLPCYFWRTCVYFPVLFLGFGDPQRSRSGRYSARTQRALRGSGRRAIGQLAGFALLSLTLAPLAAAAALRINLDG